MSGFLSGLRRWTYANERWTRGTVSGIRPMQKVIHRGGESFGKHLLVRKQFWVFRSASQYLEKHFGLRAWWATIPMKLASVALGFFVNEQSRLWAGACMLSSVAYLFSYLSYFFLRALAGRLDRARGKRGSIFFSTP